MEGNLLWHWYTTLCTTLCWSPAIDAIKDEKYREKMRKIWSISLSFIVYCWVFLIFIHNYLFIPCAVFCLLGFFPTPFIQIGKCRVSGGFLYCAVNWLKMRRDELWRADTWDTDCRQIRRHMMQPPEIIRSLTILFLKYEK